jgi:hypothetical protein
VSLIARGDVAPLPKHTPSIVQHLVAKAGSGAYAKIVRRTRARRTPLRPPVGYVAYGFASFGVRVFGCECA